MPLIAPEKLLKILPLISVKVLVTLTTDVGRILSRLHQVQPNGYIKFGTAIRVAHTSPPLPPHGLETALLSEEDLKRQQQREEQPHLENARNNKTNRRATIYQLDYRWSSWTQFTACSRSCGIGVKSRQRSCYQIGRTKVPVDGIKCHGQTHHYITCNNQACPSGSRDFRELQCAFFNGQRYAGLKRKWKPVRSVSRSPLWNVSSVNPCVLACAPEKMSWLVVMFTRVVVDGTSCAPSSVCVAGKCVPLGCDNVLFSSAVPDMCGVCAGDNSTCYHKHGVIKKNLTRGYEELLRLPKFARKIKIFARAEGNIILALRSEEGEYLLNGNSNNKSPSVTKLVSGAIFYYHHSVYKARGMETLHAEEAIDRDLVVLGFTSKKNTSIQLKYEYIVTFNNVTVKSKETAVKNEPSFTWQTLLDSQLFFDYNPVHARPHSNSPTEGLATRALVRPHPAASVYPSDGHFKTAPSSYGPNVSPGKLKESDAYSANVNDSKVSKKHHRNNHRRVEERNIHYYSSLGSASPLPLSLSIHDRNKELRKHIYVKIVSPSSSPTFSSTSKGRKRSKTKTNKNRTLEKSSTKNRTARYFPKISSISQRRRKARNNQNESVQVSAPKKKRFPVFLPALSTVKENLNTYRKKGARKASHLSIQLTFFSCFNIRLEKVEDKFCDGQAQPDPSYHECTRKECPARWVVGLWSECSRSCDVGEQVRSVRCWRMLAPGFDSSVHVYLCNTAVRPASSRKCNNQPCGPQWEMSTWSTCSSLCGYGIQRRHVRCNSGNEIHCNRSTKPTTHQSCFHPPCVHSWKVKKWSKCNGPCGRGVQHRDVICVDRNGIRSDIRSCDKNTKPQTVQGCGFAPYCPSMWVPQAYDTCSASCGQGIVTRKVVCGRVVRNSFQLQSDAHCRHKPRPTSTTTCTAKPCLSSWYVTEWSKCSKTCGRNAVRVREVICYHKGSVSDKCEPSEKPRAIEACASSKCPESDDDCEDDAAINCQYVRRIQQCQSSYFKKLPTYRLLFSLSHYIQLMKQRY
ncbi:ADAMTS 2 isoform X1 [Octopus vulgaris]|uniref:ADAMTS 2 isoform X1 n=1 Tax=Octopus vulgaris TaxID=6645 RepID=A0AA36FIZ8_OCTVU|nr:ADAMTS 2 isoform X1 [Octopus vulgaris]